MRYLYQYHYRLSVQYHSQISVPMGVHFGCGYGHLFGIIISSTTSSSSTILTTTTFTQRSCIFWVPWRWAWSTSLSSPVCPHHAGQWGPYWGSSTASAGNEGRGKESRSSEEVEGGDVLLCLCVLVHRIVVTVSSTAMCPGGLVG